MALTPDDVVNKRFQPTKFREGYDQDEVDDFLDEVVVELRRLTQENDELRQRLGSGDSSLDSAAQVAFGEPVAEPVVAEPVPAPVVAAAVAAPAYAAVSEDDTSDSGSANSLLQLARRLHEEHVREGAEKRDSLIAEGHATAARMVEDAQAQQSAELAAFTQERTQLESRVEELRTFEREYRLKLKSYIEGQLNELNAIGEPAATSAAEVPVADIDNAEPEASEADDDVSAEYTAPDYAAPAEYTALVDPAEPTTGQTPSSPFSGYSSN